MRSTEWDFGPNRWIGFRGDLPGYRAGMGLPLLLIIIGIVLAVLVSYALGLICILIGLVLLIWPRLRTSV